MIAIIAIATSTILFAKEAFVFAVSEIQFKATDFQSWSKVLSIFGPSLLIMLFYWLSIGRLRYRTARFAEHFEATVFRDFFVWARLYKLDSLQEKAQQKL